MRILSSAAAAQAAHDRQPMTPLPFPSHVPGSEGRSADRQHLKMKVASSVHLQLSHIISNTQQTWCSTYLEHFRKQQFYAASHLESFFRFLRNILH